MNKPVLLRAAVLLIGLLPAVAGGAQGTTLYVNRVVTAGKGEVVLGTVIRVSGPLTPRAQEALSRSVTVLGDAVQYLPASVSLPQVEAAFGANSIIVGSRTILIPRGTSAEGEEYLLDKLVDFLQAQGLLDENKVDIAFTQNSIRGAPPQDGNPSCQVMKSARGVEVSFLLTGSNGNAVSGRLTLAPASEGPDRQRGVKSSAPVRVVFRKGLITVEMPGKALASAAVGENVSVYISDSQKTFTGRVTDGKAVQVDLP